MQITELIIGPQTPIGTSWFDTNQVTRGRAHAAAFPDTPPANLDPYIMLHYYDLGLTQYVLHARTNDPQDLANANRITDSWWKMAWIDEGRRRPWPDDSTPAPRHAGIGGLILRAQGRPEMWDWINSYTRFAFDLWIKRRLTGPQLYYGPREGAFMLQAATWLSQALPDSFPLQAGGTATNGAQLRAQYLADCELAATDYYGRLQYPDGSWRNDDTVYRDADGGTLVGVMQPFMAGLLTNALVDVHRVSSNPVAKISIQDQITKACRHLYNDGPYMNRLIPSLGVNDRGFNYFYHGGTTVNPTKYANGNYPANWDTTDRGQIESIRQTIGSVIAPFGYAFHITQDPFFKTAGDEMWDAAYVGTDGIRGWAHGDSKSYNMNYRNAGRYLAWTGTPITPPPTVQPSPDGTKAITITDSEGKVWTIGPAGETLRDGVHVGTGRGTIYKYLSSVVYVFGANGKWYQWANEWLLIGSEPGIVVPPPVIATDTFSLKCPVDRTQRDTLIEAQYKKGFELTEIDAGFAYFQRR